MRFRRILWGFLFVTAIFLSATSLLRGATNAEIVVDGADIVRSEVTGPSGLLNGLLAAMQSRILVEHADILATPNYGTPAAALVGLANSIANRVLLDHADRVRHEQIEPLAGPFANALASLVARVLLDAADINVTQELSYPLELLDDRTAPVVSTLSVAQGAGAWQAKWTTDEFSRCNLTYYANRAEPLGVHMEDLFHKEHEQVIVDLQADTDYTVEVRCTDLAGNAAALRSMTFKVEAPQANPELFLPHVTK